MQHLIQRSAFHPELAVYACVRGGGRGLGFEEKARVMQGSGTLNRARPYPSDNCNQQKPHQLYHYIALANHWPFMGLSTQTIPHHTTLQHNNTAITEKCELLTPVQDTPCSCCCCMCRQQSFSDKQHLPETPSSAKAIQQTHTRTCGLLQSLNGRLLCGHWPWCAQVSTRVERHATVPYDCTRYS